MKSKKYLVLAAAAAAFSASAHAQFYVGGGIGTSKFKADDADVNAVLVLGGPTSTVSRDERGTGYKLYAGYGINQNFSVELGYADLGKATYDFTTPGSALTSSVEGKLSGFSASVLGKIPLGQQFTLFGKIGAFNGKSSTNYSTRNTATGVRTFSYDRSESKTSLLLGLGGEYAFTPNLKLRAEYEDFGNSGTAVTGANTPTPGGTGRTRASLFSVSVNYGF